MVKMTTIIEGLIEEKKIIDNKIAENMASTIIEKKRNGKMTESTCEYVCNVLKDLSREEQVRILKLVINILANKMDIKKKKEKVQNTEKFKYFK